MTASQELTAPPDIQATWVNLNTARIANVDSIESTPNAATYRMGSTSSTVGTPKRASRRFVTNSDSRNATPVERPKKRPKNPASSSGSGYRAVAARRTGGRGRRTTGRTGSSRTPASASASSAARSAARPGAVRPDRGRGRGTAAPPRPSTASSRHRGPRPRPAWRSRRAAGWGRRSRTPAASSPDRRARIRARRPLRSTGRTVGLSRVGDEAGEPHTERPTRDCPLPAAATTPA